MPGTNSSFDALLKAFSPRKKLDKTDVEKLNTLKQERRDKLASAFKNLFKEENK